MHIPHAASDITLYRMFGLDYYDAVLLSGEYQVQEIRNLEKLRNLPEKELTIIGIPYMDEMAKRLENRKNMSEQYFLHHPGGRVQSSVFLAEKLSMSF